MPDGLQFVLILPDGSKSLIRADWTDFKNPSGPPQNPQLLGSLDDLLRLRCLADTLLRRAASLPVRSGASQEGHAATESELQRHSDSGDALVQNNSTKTKNSSSSDSGAPPRQSHAGQTPGANQ
jgi:hypothetical protein